MNEWPWTGIVSKVSVKYLYRIKFWHSHQITDGSTDGQDLQKSKNEESLSQDRKSWYEDSNLWPLEHKARHWLTLYVRTISWTEHSHCRRDEVKNVGWWQWKSPLPVGMRWCRNVNYCGLHLQKNTVLLGPYWNNNFTKIPPVGAGQFRAGWRTDGYYHANSRFSQFSEPA
jgi:hypothetical protein